MVVEEARGSPRAIGYKPGWRGAVFDMVKRLCGRGGGPAGLPVRHAVGRKLGKSEPSCASGLVSVRDTDAEIKRLRAFGGCLGTERR